MITLEQGISKVLEKIGRHRIYNNESVSCCPFCGAEEHKFYLNTTTGLYNCKRASCGVKGNINNLLEKLGIPDRVGSDSMEVKEVKEKHLNIDMSKYRDIQVVDKIADYMISRGIGIETLNNSKVMTNNYGDRLVFLTKNGAKYVNVSYRTMDKHIYMESGSGQFLWGREDLNYKNKTIYITEGRIDCLTLKEMGIDNAVSMPNGASSHEWITSEWDLLSKFENIVLCYDNDDAGAKGLELAKIRLDFAILNKLELGEYKDINDAYMQDCEFLYNAVRKPERLELDGFISLNSVSTSDGVNTELYSCGIQQLDRILGGIRLGESTLIVAPSGVGKSTILCNMVNGLLSTGEKTGVYSGELTNASLKAWLYSVIGGKDAVDFKPHPFRKGENLTFIKQDYEKKIDKAIDGKLFVYDGGKSDGYLMLKHFSTLNKRFGVKFFFIDNLSILSTAVKGMGQYEGEENFAKVLAEFCRTHRAHVFLFAHPTKQSLNTNPDFIGRDGKVKPIERYDQYNVRGSASHVNLTHNIMFLMKANEHIKLYFAQVLSQIYQDAGDEAMAKEIREKIRSNFSLLAYLVKNRGAGKTYEDVLFGYDYETRRIYGLVSQEEDLHRTVTELLEEDTEEDNDYNDDIDYDDI